MNRRELIKSGLGLVSLTALASGTAAHGKYPEYPIRFIAPRAAGGVIDIASRMWADRITPYLGTRFIIENQTGGGGTIGATTVARATPDGYTLLAGSGSELVVSYLIANKPTY